MNRPSTTRSRFLPTARGYRMPAEWEAHESTWLAWPHFCDDWPGKFDPIPWVYAEIIRNLARHERVDLIVNSASWEKRARSEEHTSELQSHSDLVCRLLLEKKKYTVRAN